MKMVFVSNYFNHHQRSLCETLNRESGGHFLFLETVAMRQERKDLGYGIAKKPAYVIDCTDGRDVFAYLPDADVIILGIGDYSFRKRVLSLNKPTFLYSERILKQGVEPQKLLIRRIRFRALYARRKNVYLLSVGDYTYRDYRRFGLFRNRALRWGYFPAFEEHSDPDGLMNQKDPRRIIWCGRFLDWKHMETAVEAVALAVQRGCLCWLDFVGTGEEEERIRALIRTRSMEHYIGFLGAMKPDEVREQMKRSAVLLITSDRSEGWGAVVNEAMNSGCAVISSDAVGAATYLIRDKENGLIAESGNPTAFADAICRLMTDSEYCRRIGERAYVTIRDEWNAAVAGKRLWRFAEAVCRRSEPVRYPSGPLSDASVEAKESE